jgi:hypothetical protein
VRIKTIMLGNPMVSTNSNPVSGEVNLRAEGTLFEIKEFYKDITKFLHELEGCVHDNQNQ